MQFDGVNIDKIPLGLELDCKIYFERNGKFFFLCECDTVTQSDIDRFKKAVKPSNTVYISSSYLRAFYNKGIDLGWRPPEERVQPASKPKPVVENEPPKTYPSYEETKRQYEEVKNETSELFADIAKEHRLNKNKTEAIAADISHQLETNDVSLILQSINGLRSIDEYLHTHSLNVAFLNGMMAKWLGYDRESYGNLVRIGLLHDIGKLKVPNEILSKPARLTEEEFSEVKKHSHYSFEMLVEGGIEDKRILLGVLQHHEKLNGVGYPNGVGSDKIHDYAKITAISDIYDAMSAKRVYKDAHSPFAILDSFSKESYSELDISFVGVFIDCMAKELKGKLILLSDGSVAKVLLVNKQDLQYPMVELDGRVIQTSPELYCVSMYVRAPFDEIEKVIKEVR